MHFHLTPEAADLVGYLLTGIVGIIVALIERNAQRNRKIDDEREKRRRREAKLSMDLMAATVELSDLSAIALQNGKLNGNVEQARERARKALAAYSDFLRDVGSEVI